MLAIIIHKMTDEKRIAMHILSVVSMHKCYLGVIFVEMTFSFAMHYQRNRSSSSTVSALENSNLLQTCN